MTIKKAIIPVGGYGTRFLPSTKAQPKEMLTLVDKPVIQYLVEEAAASGITEIIFVTCKGKRAVEDHFDRTPELENFLESRGKEHLAKEIRRIASLAKFTYVRQNEPAGPGDALLRASHLIGQEPVAVLYGDDVVDSKVPCLKQMIQVFEKYQKPVLALERVARKDVSRYGVIGGRKIAPRTYRVSAMIEKPDAKEAPSNLATIGKYIYTPELYGMLPGMKAGKGGEMWPTEIMDRYVKKGGELYGYEYEGVRYDCGDKLGFLKAAVITGLKHGDLGREFRQYIKNLNI